MTNSTLLPAPDLMVDCAQGMVPGWTESALADMLKRAAFGAWAARESRRCGGIDIDGGDAQDDMEKRGVLVKREVTQRCGEECICADYGDFPQDCYKYPPGVAQIVKAQK